MVLLNFTFFLVQLFYGVWFTVQQDHRCGPIASGSYGWAPIEEKIEASKFLLTLYNMITYYPLLWNLIMLITVIGYFNKNEAKVIQKFTDQEKADARKIMEEQGKQIARLKRKLEFQKTSLAI